MNKAFNTRLRLPAILFEESTIQKAVARVIRGADSLAPRGRCIVALLACGLDRAAAVFVHPLGGGVMRISVAREVPSRWNSRCSAFTCRSKTRRAGLDPPRSNRWRDATPTRSTAGARPDLILLGGWSGWRGRWRSNSRSNCARAAATCR